MKRQAMTVTPGQLQKLKSELIHQQQELQKGLGLKDWMVVDSSSKFQINIINKTPEQCDTWEIENNNQKQNVLEGVSNSDALGTIRQTASSDTPQDDPGKANVADNGDTSDSTFPADYNQITRIEIIEKGIRKFVKWNCLVETSIQNKGRTLKIFVSENNK